MAFLLIKNTYKNSPISCSCGTSVLFIRAETKEECDK